MLPAAQLARMLRGGRANMSDKPDIAIIGPGVVGTTLGILAARAGYRVAGVAGRTEEKARAAAARIGPDVAVGTPAEVAGAGKLVLLTVPDDAIEPLCRQLAEAGAFARGAVVAHCCGAIPGEVLAPAREHCAAAVGSMHPLQTFPNVEAALAKLPDAFCFCDGDDAAVAALTALAEAIGARPVRMSSAGKLLYHASAVMACNYLTALLDASLATAEHAEVPRDQAREALAPLIRATLENIFSLGTSKALTGPIARGDDALVARQYRDVAAADPALGEIYRALGHWTVGVALKKGTIGEPEAARLRAIFSRPED